ncbi:MAG: hypothetical protein PUF72_08705 [Clostridiales bacterium]|nr:hypothetical protein [Clostridiales bacterium]
MKNKKKGQLIGEIIIGAAVTALLCTILIPSIAKCFENAGINSCRRNMTNIMSTLEKQLNSGTETGKWSELLSQKKSQQLLAQIVPLMPENQRDIELSDYYFSANGDTLKLICKKHDKIDDISITLPEAYTVTDTDISASKKADRLIINGIRNYAKGTALDPADASKMTFAPGEDISALFPSLEVSVGYADGSSAALAAGAYTITSQGLDMNSAGTKKVNINYFSKNALWSDSLSAGFVFEVLERSECPPLQTRLSKTDYEAEAWNWNDFVLAANAQPDGSKSFGAALIFFDNHYYYYPEGFLISKENDNSSPTNAAADRSSPAVMARYIEILPDKTASQTKKETEEGALSVINGELCTYRKKTRLEAGGWLRLYTPVKSTPAPAPVYYDDDDDDDDD